MAEPIAPTSPGAVGLFQQTEDEGRFLVERTARGSIRISASAFAANGEYRDVAAFILDDAERAALVRALWRPGDGPEPVSQAADIIGSVLEWMATSDARTVYNAERAMERLRSALAGLSVPAGRQCVCGGKVFEVCGDAARQAECCQKCGRPAATYAVPSVPFTKGGA